MLDNTTAEAIATLLAAAMLITGAVFIVLPVLPGSLVIVGSLLLWGLLIGGTTGWVAAIIGILLTLIGWSMSLILTGRVMKKEDIPRAPILAALACGLVGLFLLPPLGLPIGFAAGLFFVEAMRRDWDWKGAGSASWETLKAVGAGMLLEIGLAGTAIGVFVVGSVIHFFL